MPPAKEHLALSAPEHVSGAGRVEVVIQLARRR